MKIRSTLHQVILLTLWAVARHQAKRNHNSLQQSNKVLLVTADAQTLIGSRGDEAMLHGAIGEIRKNNISSEIFIACATIAAEKITKTLRCTPFHVWGGIFMPQFFLKTLKMTAPRLCLFMGADIMDGHYSAVNSLRMIIAADLAAKYGSVTRFLGFSLNSESKFAVKLAFKLLDPRVQVNLRDPISLVRYRAIVGTGGYLVADTAFLLKPVKPSEDTSHAFEWIERQHTSGRLVLGINFHPMLFEKQNAENLTKKLTSALISSMSVTSKSTPISWLLIPHDDRLEAGDITSLTKLEALLPKELATITYRIQTPPPAAQLKTIAGCLDGVVTGRMHLAIASLGQGVPVLTFGYQGKFEGLIRHFDLPEWIVLSPTEAIESAYLSTHVLRFISELPSLRRQTESKLPVVLAATQATFDQMK